MLDASKRNLLFPVPFNALSSDEETVFAQVDALLKQPAAVLCLAGKLLL